MVVKVLRDNKVLAYAFNPERKVRERREKADSMRSFLIPPQRHSKMANLKGSFQGKVGHHLSVVVKVLNNDQELI